MRIWTALLIVPLVLVGCKKTSTEPTNTYTIQAGTNLVFDPQTLTIPVGQSVTWVFGATTHQVVFDQITGAPGDMQPYANTEQSRTFNTVGTFDFHCAIHPQMTGSIIVTAASTP